MSKITSREIRLASRPKGVPTADNFTPAQTELKPLQDQQVLVRNLFMSVDPYMRGRMNAGKSYVPPFELGKPLEGGAIGEVIESCAKEFKPKGPSGGNEKRDDIIRLPHNDIEREQDYGIQERQSLQRQSSQDVQGTHQ